MRRLDETQAIRTDHDEGLQEAFDTRPAINRAGAGRPDVRLRVVAAPGGFAFLEDETFIERSC